MKKRSKFSKKTEKKEVKSIKIDQKLINLKDIFIFEKIFIN
jgi:hypothetical protein